MGTAGVLRQRARRCRGDAHRYLMLRLPLPASIDPAVEVWRLDLDPTRPVDAAAWGDLDEAERARALALRMPADRLRYVATRSALRRLLGQRLDCPGAGLRFEAGVHGKPLLAGRADVAFSVSHAGAHALIALGGTAALGVDIEEAVPDAPEAGVLARVLSGSEHAWVQADPAAFYAIWTAKEALLKAHGTGVLLAPQRLCVAPGAHDALHLVEAPPEIAAATPRIWRLHAPPGYAAALALIGS